MNFFLFILLNGVLLIRPEEVMPDLDGLRLYLITISLCIITTLPQLLAQLDFQSLSRRPITVCALGLLPAMALSHLAHGRADVFDNYFPEFVKVLLYFLLFMAIINTPSRMLAFMGCLVFFVIVLAVLALLSFFEYIDVEALKPIMQTGAYNDKTGTNDQFPRLCSSGIFHDPNDLCLILTTGSLCCLCLASFCSSQLMRLLWLGPIGLFGYAMTLTASRGGLLGFLAGVLGYCYARFGARKLIPLTLVLVPAALALIGGRQADINTSGNDTSQERIRLWAQGLSLMFSNPINVVCGIGAGEFDKEMGQVAHNSFVEAFVELGLCGGPLFLGAFYLAVLGVWKMRQEGVLDDQPLLRHMHPFVFAMVVGYAGGIYSLSRNYVIPTYLMLAIAASFMSMAYPRVPDWFRFDGRMVKKLAVIGVLGIAFLKLFTQSLVKWSG